MSSVGVIIIIIIIRMCPWYIFHFRLYVVFTLHIACRMQRIDEALIVAVLTAQLTFDDDSDNCKYCLYYTPRAHILVQRKFPLVARLACESKSANRDGSGVQRLHILCVYCAVCCMLYWSHI